MADDKYITSQTYSATIGGIAYNVTASIGGTSTNSGVYSVKAYGATGDGSTDDTTFIQNAIGAAETAGGGEVYFPAGTYKTSASLTVDSANITLTGSWAAVITSSTNASHINVDAGANNCKVTDLSFATTAASGFTAGRACIDVNPSAGTSVNNVVISRCRIDSPRTGGIGGEKCTNVVVSDNVIEGAGEHGIYFGALTDRITISNNVLDGVSAATTAHSGIKFVGDNATITGNHITGYTAAGSCAGILIEDMTGNATISGNLIDGCREGMRIIDSSNISVTGNTFTDCVLDGYYGDITMNTAAGTVDNISITGNTFFRSIAAGNGVPIEDVGTGTLSNVLFAGNTIGGNYAGDWRSGGTLHAATSIVLGFNNGGAKIPSYQAGSGSPNTAVTAPKGSIYSDYTNATLYQNDDGSTAWTETKT